MEKRPRTRRIEYRLFLWAEDERGNATIWQGVVETASGQHFHFRTLTELDQILYELAGWMDPPTTRTLELP